MKLNNIAGLTVRFHWSVLILVAIITANLNIYLMTKYHDASVLQIVSTSFLSALCLVLSVLIHEFGHVIVGRRFGVGFGSITLFMFGGAANMDSNVPSPKAEAIMAVAGPATSLLLALISFLVLMAHGFFVEVAEDQFTIFTMTLRFILSINLALGYFNLIPAFPLDGGRILRSAVWAISKNFLFSTKVASWSGRALGTAMAVSGVFMCFGFDVPLLGTGVGGGVWMIFLGTLVHLLAFWEYKGTLILERQKKHNRR